MEHILRTTHGPVTRMGCRRAGGVNDSGGGNGDGDGGCSCESATEQEVKEAVEEALGSLGEG
ncbi:MAG: hypothetical protein K2K81_07395 [Muribaculaceae bacterium]|nr:hypothetical protein [Muribaculaceae bacterium]